LEAFSAYFSAIEHPQGGKPIGGVQIEMGLFKSPLPRTVGFSSDAARFYVPRPQVAKNEKPTVRDKGFLNNLKEA
jgi:hypothetical protein